MSMDAGRQHNRALSVLSLCLSIAALAIAVLSLIAWRRQSDTYGRIVSEVWTMVQPTYSEFGIPAPAAPPRTLEEALGPLLSLPTQVETRSARDQLNAPGGNP